MAQEFANIEPGSTAALTLNVIQFHPDSFGSVLVIFFVVKPGTIPTLVPPA
jgi:hypothetical protein